VSSKGFLNIKKINSDKKNPKAVIQGPSTAARNYF
jgi:hypothetical protein